MTRTIVDTGPLVALFNRRDKWHQWVVAQMTALPPPLVTCEAVVAETCLLIHKADGRPADLARKISEGNLQIGVRLTDDAAAVESLMHR